MDLAQKITEAADNAVRDVTNDVMNGHGATYELPALRWGPTESISRIISAQASYDDYPADGDSGALDVAQRWARTFRLVETRPLVPGTREWAGRVENCHVRIWCVSDHDEFMGANRRSGVRKIHRERSGSS